MSQYYTAVHEKLKQWVLNAIPVLQGDPIFNARETEGRIWNKLTEPSKQTDNLRQGLLQAIFTAFIPKWKK